MLSCILRTGDPPEIQASSAAYCTIDVIRSISRQRLDCDAHPLLSVQCVLAIWTALFLVPLGLFALAGAPTRPIARCHETLGARYPCGPAPHRWPGLRGRRARAYPISALPDRRQPSVGMGNAGFPGAGPRCRNRRQTRVARNPVVGWFLRRSPMIVIDRTNGTQALRTMIRYGREAVAAGRSVLIFPEGTRGSISDPLQFKRGVELLYGRLDLPVVPVAVNSGLFWPGGSALQAGTVVVSYLAAVRPGLSAGEFLAGTERAIDQELNRWRHVSPVTPEAVVS